MNPFAIIASWLAKSFQFSGRASRSEYWMQFGKALLITIAFQSATLIPILLSLTKTNVPAPLAFDEYAPIVIVIVASMAVLSFLMLSTTARRFQDHGWSGRWFKWMFFLLAPALLFVVVALLGMALKKNSLSMIGLVGSFSTLIPTYASIIYSFWIGFVKPDPMTNEYGPNPLEVTP